MTNYKPYPNYKPSGIEWLGEIPQHWEVRKLKNNSTIVNGATPSSSNPEYWDGDILWVTPAEINNLVYLSDSKRKITIEGYKSCGTFLVPIDSIILTTRAPIGKLAITKKELCTNQGCKSIIPNNLNTKFGYYQLLIRVKELNGLGTGTTFMELGGSELKNLHLAYPPITEQTAIAHFLNYKLSKIDRFIHKKKQLIKLLNAQKAAIINDLILKGLDNSVKMKNSGEDWIGDIPAHWQVKRTKLLFQLVTEVAPPNNTEVLLSIYTQYGVKPRTEFEERGNRATTTDNYWLVKKQDIIVNKLLAWMGAIGISEYDGVTSPAYDILRSKGEANPYYYHYLFRSPVAFTEFKRHSRGIMDVRLRLYFNRFGDIKLPVPPLEEQAAIVAHIESETAHINTLIQTIEKEIALTQEYRTALIAEAVTGKIDVRGYEVPEVLEEDVLEVEDEMEEEIMEEEE